MGFVFTQMTMTSSVLKCVLGTLTFYESHCLKTKTRKYVGYLHDTYVPVGFKICQYFFLGFQVLFIRHVIKNKKKH